MSEMLSEDERRIRDSVRRLAEERVRSRAMEIDASGEYPQDMFELLKGFGLFALPFPPEFGGSGSLFLASLAIEELCRLCYNTAYLLILQWTPFAALFAGGSDEQKKRLLPGLAAGDLRAAIALTEPQSGSDLAGIRTRARRVEGGYRLAGGKVWCTGASVADFILVAARVEGAGINLFIVEKGAEGFAVGRAEKKMGARGVPSSALHLDDVFVGENERVGAEEGGFKIVMEGLNRTRPLIAARAVGLAQGAMELAIDFVKNRRAFGASVGDFQGVRWMIADMGIEIEAARSLLYRTARAVDEGLAGTALAPLAAMAKCLASDVAMRVATQALQLFGASGISSEMPINRYFRDAKVLQIVEGTNEIQRNIIARSLLGPPGRA